MKSRVILIALDSVGIDPLGHNRPDSVYSESRFLFPAGHRSFPLRTENTSVPGAIVETTVAPDCSGAIECAITYPKSKVPTWYFGPDAERQASRMSRPEGIFEVIAECAPAR
jgi:hypothetical protein